MSPKPFTPVQTRSASARAVAAPALVRSWTGTRTRLHASANHGPWLSIALFLDELSKAAPADVRKRSAHSAGAAAEMLAGPVGNHGDNECWTASPAREVRF